jgi:hypothetical protein
MGIGELWLCIIPRVKCCGAKAPEGWRSPRRWRAVRERQGEREASWSAVALHRFVRRAKLRKAFALQVGGKFRRFCLSKTSICFLRRSF